ncbi:hypothetical protein [Peredibacter starrii]|uniref:Uncharacterized protein n=1 Tax=Peredibacter starrii TaxID=28202 RepID=A0AAX4HR85_9BACT|nr:hypothetical protein [Peredibacter starrii]WPU65732.1 hypothetical protein SOO65_03135 [Peredibacter starrii]
MAWISLFLLFLSVEAAELPRFLTKHSPETLRFISMDGRYAYVQKKPGVLGMVSSFRSLDFIAEASSNDYLVKSSRFKQRLAIESIPNAHDEYNFLKNNRIMVVDFGNTITRDVGFGRNSKLHLKDEWISYFNAVEKVLHIQNLVTQKKYDIRLSKKANPFFVPEVEMVSSSTVIYTDINENGYSALIAYDLISQKSNIIYRSPQSATRLEMCQQENYLAVGEFPFEGVSRGSKILKFAGEMRGTSYTTLYSSVEQDLGNMVCLPEFIYFVKTMTQDKQINHRTTEAVRLNLKTQDVEVRSELKNVGQLLEMDGRVLIPLRGEFFVLEGKFNLGEDILKAVPTKEELQLDL